MCDDFSRHFGVVEFWIGPLELNLRDTESTGCKSIACGHPRPVRPDPQVRGILIECSLNNQKNVQGGLPAIIEPEIVSPEEQLFEAWRAVPNVIRPRRMTTALRKKIATRLRDPDFRDGWPEAFRMVASSEFLTGGGDRGWRASLEWILKPVNYSKVVDGHYPKHSGPREHAGLAEFLNSNQGLLS